MSLRFTRIRDVESPKRGNPDDAGIDLFVPDLDREGFRKEFEIWNVAKEAFLVEDVEGSFIRVEAGGRVRIPSGTKWDIPKGMALMGFNKSGVSFKKRLNLMSQVIDSGYQGELILNFQNVGDSPLNIYSGDKIIQFLLIPVFTPAIFEVESEEILFPEVSARGDGGFGSTGV
jgi:dUTPase